MISRFYIFNFFFLNKIDYFLHIAKMDKNLTAPFSIKSTVIWMLVFNWHGLPVQVQQSLELALNMRWTRIQVFVLRLPMTVSLVCLYTFWSDLSITQLVLILTNDGNCFIFRSWIPNQDSPRRYLVVEHFSRWQKLQFWRAQSRHCSWT